MPEGVETAKGVHSSWGREGLQFLTSGPNRLPPRGTSLCAIVAGGSGGSGHAQISESTQRCAVRAGPVGGQDPGRTGGAVAARSAAAGKAELDMRIVSFLPSATEMVYALGLGDHLAGVTHECDYPPAVKSKPVVVRSAIETKDLTSHQIDGEVSRMLKAGQSLYTVDEALLKQLAPDLILTQDLCQVCAPSGHEIGRVLQFLPR